MNYSFKIFTLWLLSFGLGNFLSANEKIFTVSNTNLTISLDSDSSPDLAWMLSKNSGFQPKELTQKLRDIKNPSLLFQDKWTKTRVPGNPILINNLPENTPEIWLALPFIMNDTDFSHLGIQLGWISDRDRTYLNGELIGKTGEWDSPVAQAYDKIRVYPVPDKLIKPGQINLLMVHIRGLAGSDIGIIHHTTAIGKYSALKEAIIQKYLSELLLLMVYLTAGLYFLFLFFRRRSDRENLIFGLFCISLFLYQAIKTQYRFEFNISFISAKRLEYIILYLTFPLFYYFLRTFFDFSGARFMRIWDKIMLLPVMVHVAAILHVIISDNASQWWALQKNITQPVWLFFIAGIFLILIHKALKKDKDAIIILSGFILLVLGMCIDILSSRNLINIPPVVSYFFTLFVLNMAMVLANRFVRLHEQVEDLNQNLEKKVEQRTVELNQSLTQISQLKQQQDGDYFLTSLLIKPLAQMPDPAIVNPSSNNHVQLSGFCRQKKQFHFGNYHAEIGGDINIARKIEIRGKTYIAIINADAMGKSLQGAGGALVVGVMFNSFIERTLASINYRNKLPEQWLRDSFTDMQKVFTTFNGSMLASMVIGLIDEDNGFLYYINAEHPWVVLYRDKKAEFIDDSNSILRKVGIEILPRGLVIRTLKLEDQDSVFIGSDGRDDLVINNDDTERVINSDENLFLRLIEDADGDITSLVHKIEKAGTLTDDLSLIKLTFFRASQPEQARKKTWIHQIKRSLKDRSFAQAIEHIESFLTQFPEESQMYYFASYAHAKCGNWNSACDYGEGLRLREPHHLKNLLHLSQCYINLGIPKRAQKVLSKAMVLEPHHPLIPRIHEILRKKYS